jgi:glycosyltransferase involved in cell wall biosynthesis
MAERKISVIVACRNEARHAQAFLDSLLAQRTAGLDVEFIIADGRSEDRTPEILRAYAAAHPSVRVIDNPGRIVSTGLNAAIRASRGGIVVRMDAHTEFDPDYISACVETLDRTGADNVGGPARTKADTFMSRAVAAAYHSRFSTGGARFHDPRFEGFVDTVTYGCWRRETLERLGYFDENLVRNQDDELNYRLILSGGRIYQSPRIVSWYRPRGSLRSLFLQYFQYGFWKVAVIRKHRLPASWRHLVPCAFVVLICALLLAVLAGLGMGNRDAARWAALLLAGVLGSYLAAALAFSWQAAKGAGLDLLPVLPLVFSTYHFSYGLGFLAGLAVRRTPGSGQWEPGGVFTQISR